MDRRTGPTVSGRRRTPVSASPGGRGGGASPCFGGFRTATRLSRVTRWSVRARVAGCRRLGPRATRLGRGEVVRGEAGETGASGAAAPEVAVVGDRWEAGEVPGAEDMLGGVLSKTVPDESGARCRTGRGRMRGETPVGPSGRGEVGHFLIHRANMWWTTYLSCFMLGNAALPSMDTLPDKREKVVARR